MTTVAHTIADSRTMFRRQLRHQQRNPGILVMLVAMPVIFLLLFVYVFGGTLGQGLAGGGGRRAYVEYVTPGILLMAIASVAQGTAISVAVDMTEGIVARFRSMSISRAAVMTGHVVAAVIETLVGLAVVVGVAVAMGFRPDAGVVEWLAAVGLLTGVSLALTWLTVAMGMSTKSVEAASNLPMPLMLLPFFGSGFVPTGSMPPALRWFADHQPFTPFTETLRGLLTGTAIGSSAVVSVLWCAGLSLIGYAWSRARYVRGSVR